MAQFEGSMRRASAGISIMPASILVVISMLIGGVVTAVAVEATSASGLGSAGAALTTPGDGLDTETRDYLTRISAGLAVATPTSAPACSVLEGARVSHTRVARLVHVPE